MKRCTLQYTYIYIYIYIYTRIFGPRFARPRFFPESSPSPEYMCTGKFKILPAQSTGILDIYRTKICVASYHAFKISKYSRAQNPQVWNTRWAQHSKYPRAPSQNNRWVQNPKYSRAHCLKYSRTQHTQWKCTGQSICEPVCKKAKDSPGPKMPTTREPNKQKMR